MEIDTSTENSIWLFDYGALMEDDVSARGTTCFSWPSQDLNCCSNVSVEIDCSFGDLEALKETGSRKRLKSESCNASGSKACREKSRRDRLNERFVELGSVLEPGRPPKTDKAAILGDAVHMVGQLRSEAQKLRESNEDLQEKIKELKAEKNELRVEKQTMKEEKEKLEQQVKALTSHPVTLLLPCGNSYHLLCVTRRMITSSVLQLLKFVDQRSVHVSSFPKIFHLLYKFSLFSIMLMLGS